MAGPSKKARVEPRPPKGTRKARNGGRLNSGGTFPGGGRPPDEFRATMRSLVSRKETIDYLEECLQGKHGAAVFLKAAQFAADRGYGKADQVVTVNDERVVRFPVPPKDTKEWLERYGPVLHSGGAKA